MCVHVLKIGTNTIINNPNTNIFVPCGLVSSSPSSSAAILPLNAGKKEAMTVGINIHTNEGRSKNSIINSIAVTLFPSSTSIVVVTSPIGDQAPPAFAATNDHTCIPHTHSRASVYHKFSKNCNQYNCGS